MDPSAIVVAIIGAIPICAGLMWSILRDVRKVRDARVATQDALEDRNHKIDIENAVLKLENDRLKQDIAELRRQRREDYGRGH